MSAENGARAVVADAVSGVAARIAGERAAAEQISMFEVPTRHAGARAEALQSAIEHRRERGRPPGAVNKSTKIFRDYLLARGVNPLQAMMQWSLHTPTSLAAELGCTRLEAFDRLMDLWGDLAPYFGAKMVPVDDLGRAAPMMLMQFGRFGVPKEAGGRAPWEYLESEQNQALLDVTADVSHGDVSHEREKPA